MSDAVAVHLTHLTANECWVFTYGVNQLIVMGGQTLFATEEAAQDAAAAHGFVVEPSGLVKPKPWVDPRIADVQREYERIRDANHLSVPTRATDITHLMGDLTRLQREDVDQDTLASLRQATLDLLMAIVRGEA